MLTPRNGANGSNKASKFMSKDLVIVFVKNLELGKVKTRLAAQIGYAEALGVYKELVRLTERITQNLPNIDTHIYFSSKISSELWPKNKKYVQNGVDLGERMFNAFKDGFNMGYDKIVLIGSDLPDLNESHLKQAFAQLNTSDIVFGPAKDGGYYLVGLKTLIPEIFENKPWSQPQLFKITLQDLAKLNPTISTLETLNDIDTFEDLITSNFYKSNLQLQEKIQHLND
jgi:rSAM/selenodomain-associated transferase 1